MKAAAQLASGSFEVSGQSYAFTLTQDGGGFKLASAGTEYRLARKATAAPAAPAPAPAPAGAGAAGSIVGSWRNATGSARFNADGTGVVDGTPGAVRDPRQPIDADRSAGTGDRAVRSARRCSHADRERSSGDAESREGGDGRG